MLKNFRMLLIVLAVGSLTAPAQSADDDKAPRRSDALDEGFQELMKDEFDFLQQRGANPPADATARTKTWEELLQLLEKSYPTLRTVTTKQFEDFKQGRFDDQANTARIKAITASASHDKMVLPDMAVCVVNSSLAGKLKGKELEAAARFLEGFMAMINQPQKK